MDGVYNFVQSHIFAGAIWGLCIAGVLCLLIYGRDKKKRWFCWPAIVFLFWVAYSIGSIPWDTIKVDAPLHAANIVSMGVLVYFTTRTVQALLPTNGAIRALAMMYALISVIIIALSIPVCNALGLTFKASAEHLYKVLQEPKDMFWINSVYIAGVLCGTALLCNCSRAFYNVTALDEGEFGGNKTFYSTISSALDILRGKGGLGKAVAGAEIVFRVACAFLLIVLERNLGELPTGIAPHEGLHLLPSLAGLINPGAISLSDVGVSAAWLYLVLLLWWARLGWCKSWPTWVMICQPALFVCGFLNAVFIAILAVNPKHTSVFGWSMAILVLSTLILILLGVLEWIAYNKNSAASQPAPAAP